MSALFTQVLTMSVTAVVLVLLVIAARLLIRRGPKVFCFLLWLVIFARILLPFSVEVTVPSAPEFDPSALVAQWAQETKNVTNEPIGVQDLPASAPAGLDALTLCGYVWAAGMAGMIVFGGISFLNLRRKLRAAVPLADNVWIADHIGAPFVVGLLRPKIYLPSDLNEQEWEYILAHERHHIRRMDHVTKLLAFAVLVTHWFNPLVWVAFNLFTKDMEMSCDEAVLKKLGSGIRSNYSQSLLNLSAGRRGPAWSPLAFGEGDTGKRIRNILRWKRPSTGVVVLTAVITAVIALSAVTEARGSSVVREQPAALTEQGLEWAASLPGECLSATISRSYSPGIAENLTEGQTAALADYLRVLSAEQISETPQIMTTLFTIEMEGGHTIRFGYQGNDNYVILDGQQVDDSSFAAFLYHVCISNGPIHYADGDLPADAVLQSAEHGVRTYTYFCEVCGQFEQASSSDSCGCCSPNEIHHFHQTRQIK